MCVCSSYRWIELSYFVNKHVWAISHFPNCKLTREKTWNPTNRFDLFWIVNIVPFLYRRHSCTAYTYHTHTHAHIQTCITVHYYSAKSFSPQIRLTFHFIFRFDVDTFSVWPNHWFVCALSHVTCIVHSTVQYTYTGAVQQTMYTQYTFANGLGHFHKRVFFARLFFLQTVNCEWQSDFGKPLETWHFPPTNWICRNPMGGIMKLKEPVVCLRNSIYAIQQIF